MVLPCAVTQAHRYYKNDLLLLVAHHLTVLTLFMAIASAEFGGTARRAHGNSCKFLNHLYQVYNLVMVMFCV